MKLHIVNPCLYFINVLFWNTSSTELQQRICLVLDELNLEIKFYHLSISQMKIPRKVPKKSCFLGRNNLQNMPFWDKQFLKDNIIQTQSNFALRFGLTFSRDVLIWTNLFIVSQVKAERDTLEWEYKIKLLLCETVFIEI